MIRRACSTAFYSFHALTAIALVTTACGTDGDSPNGSAGGGAGGENTSGSGGELTTAGAGTGSSGQAGVGAEGGTSNAGSGGNTAGGSGGSGAQGGSAASGAGGLDNSGGDNSGGDAGAGDSGGASGDAGEGSGGTDDVAGAGAGGSGADDDGGAGGASDMEPETDPGNGFCPMDFGTPPSGNMDATLLSGVVPSNSNFHIYEGAVWIDGALYFSDIDFTPWGSNIRRFVPGDQNAADFLVGTGSNGLALDADGVLYSATAGKKEISRYDLSAGTQTTAVSGSFNSPNDIAIASDGTIYFSDPQQGELPAGNQPQVVHVVKDGVDAIFDDTITEPNGLTLSPEEDILYVGGGGFTGYIKKVTLVDGLPGDIEQIASDLQVPDGMTKDCAGNLYVAVHEAQQVWVLDPDGNRLATIQLGNAANGQAGRPTNLAFGGDDRKTLYITAVYSLWEIPLQIVGYPY